MKSIILFFSILFALLPAISRVKAEGSLTAAQMSRAQHLYQSFTAPCCWRQCVAEHQSPEAARVREEIDRAVAAGQTDSQVKHALVREYGRRILLVPDGLTGILVFAVPGLATLGGLAFLLLTIRTWSGRAGSLSGSEAFLAR